MPKHLITILVFSLLSQFALANKIDDLKTDKDVGEFMNSLKDKSKDDEDIATNFIHPTQEIIDKFQKCDANIDTSAVHNWVKLDINTDGATDLLVMGFFEGTFLPYLVVDNGRNKFSATRIYHNLWFYRLDCEYTTVIKKDGKDLILFHKIVEKHLNPTQTTRSIDTLTYKFASLVEYNPNPQKQAIQSVHLEEKGCFGECPVFSLYFNTAGEATYRAVRYNPETGDFKGTIKQDKLQGIFNLLNYIDFSLLPDDYSVNWTDDTTSILTIEFTNGTTKKITDYGSVGSFGLRRIYSLIGRLRASQEWYETD